MTIIAGFRCTDGIVLCADTQETVSVGDVSLSKRKVPKLRFEQRSPHLSVLSGRHDLALAVCGAGYGPFIDKLGDELWKVAEASNDIDAACSEMEQRVKDVYADFGQIYQSGRCPEVELIYGINTQGISRLFYANGPIVNEKHGYCSAGSGCYMADYIASNMYYDGLTVRQCFILAAYILFQTKEHADGCGGDSHIAVLRERESSGRVVSNKVEAITRLVQHAHIMTGKILLAEANLGLTDEEFMKEATEILAGLRNKRGFERQLLKDWDEMWKNLFMPIVFDDLGLPEERKKSISSQSEVTEKSPG